MDGSEEDPPSTEYIAMSAQPPVERTVDGPIFINATTWAIISTDIMRTFMTAGGLGVVGGHEIVLEGLKLLRKFSRKLRYALRDLHCEGHISLCSSYVGYAQFYFLTYDEVKDWTPENHRIAPHALFTLDELKEYLLKSGGQCLWPDHAMEGTDESRVEADIERESTITWHKGNRPHVDSNSGFLENDGSSTRLDLQLRSRGVKTIVVWGIAGDVCAGLTALHGRQLGFEVYFVTDLSPCISPEGRDAMYRQLIDAGVHLVTSDQFQMAA